MSKVETTPTDHTETELSRALRAFTAAGERLAAALEPVHPQKAGAIRGALVILGSGSILSPRLDEPGYRDALIELHRIVGDPPAVTAGTESKKDSIEGDSSLKPDRRRPIREG